MRCSCPAFANTAQYHGLLKGPHGRSRRRPRATQPKPSSQKTTSPRCTPARACRAEQRTRIARRIAELTGPAARRWSRRRTCASATRPSSSRRCARRAASSAGWSRASPGRWPRSRTRDWEFDPGIEAIAAPYTMAAMAYYGEQLGLQTETRYEVLSLEVNQAWNWNRGKEQGNGYACTSTDLAPGNAPQPAPEGASLPAAATTWARPTAPATGHWPSSTSTPRVRRRAAAPLLRRRPHDVHARGRPAAAEGRRRGLAGGVGRRATSGCAREPLRVAIRSPSHRRRR